MGSMIRPVCAKCESEFEVLFLGSGLSLTEKECAVPVICDTCGYVGTDNILNPRMTCDACNNPLVYTGDIKPKDDKISVFSWRLSLDYMNERFYVLKSKMYQCPKCHTKNLNFSTAGCWD